MVPPVLLSYSGMTKTQLNIPASHGQLAAQQWPGRRPAVVLRPRFPGCLERRERAMTDQVDRTVVTQDSTAAAGQETVPAAAVPVAAVPVAAVPVAARQETVRTDSRLSLIHI